MPQAVDGTLRKFALRVPEVIYQCSGIMVFGKRIKSLVFSTDLSIIKNVNADAIIAVYPFTPQPIITQALLLAADIPVFAGVGGGLTQGQRVVNLAMFAEMQGATGVVLNAPTASAVVSHVAETIDIPVVLTVARADTDFDERIRAYVDEEISIGDYVLTGGEPAAMVVCDAIIRLQEGVILEQSHADDSFSDGLLEYPQYTKPAQFEGMAVPEVLLSGHHANIRRWRLKQSLLRTLQRRPDLLEEREFTEEELKLLEELCLERSKNICDE